jgi:hypothetical protein
MPLVDEANIPAASNEKQPGASTVQVAALPWVFTQQYPLDTDSFLDGAKRRGFDLDLHVLRELYRHSLLVPFVYVSDRQVGEIPEPAGPEPKWAVHGSTHLRNLRHARDRGRLTDLAKTPFRRKLRFERREGDSHLWWNGLIYSHYQLLALPELRDILNRGRVRIRDRGWITRLPPPGPFTLDRMVKFRHIANALTALEARYFPKLDAEWLHLNNTDETEWGQYRQAFDPVAMSHKLAYPAEKVRQDAELLLRRARHLDPFGNSWSRLVCRAPRSKWKDLKNDALLAMDYRIGAEMLLLFYEDLADRGQAELLPPFHERLSYRSQTLDQDLMDLGISPHPRVVLAVEGETEQEHVPRVWKELDYPDAPELMRLLMLGGSNKDPVKIAALAAAPLVAGKAPGQRPAWLLIKPPTRLFIAIDPEGYFAPSRVAKTLGDILDEIRAVLAAQGVERPNPAEIDELAKIHTWSASCYEFAHFNDEELAEGIMAVHQTIDGWTKDELVAALRYWRDKKKDIKQVWRSGRWIEQEQRVSGRWAYEVSKTKLAKALWPTLKAKIDRCRVDNSEPVPEIVQAVQESYYIAQGWRYQSFLLSEEPTSDEETR